MCAVAWTNRDKLSGLKIGCKIERYFGAYRSNFFRTQDTQLVIWVSALWQKVSSLPGPWMMLCNFMLCSQSHTGIYIYRYGLEIQINIRNGDCTFELRCWVIKTFVDEIMTAWLPTCDSATIGPYRLIWKMIGFASDHGRRNILSFPGEIWITDLSFWLSFFCF